jgi:hypothetical protein
MCAELLAALEIQLDELRFNDRLCIRARALLAQPVAEGPSELEQATDEEIMELMPQPMRDDLAAAARALAGFDRANIKAAGAMRIILNRHAVDHARAALARWGHPTPQPVAVSERLPGDELCWWFEPDEDDGYGGMWTLLRIRGGTTRYTYWLAANALPTPEATNG